MNNDIGIGVFAVFCGKFELLFQHFSVFQVSLTFEIQTRDCKVIVTFWHSSYLISNSLLASLMFILIHGIKIIIFAFKYSV